MSVDLNDPKTQMRGQITVAIILSLIVLGLSHHYIEKPRLDAMKAHQQNASAVTAAGDLATAATRDEVITSDQRLEIVTPRMTGSLSLRGARIDDIAMNDYAATLHSEERVHLLTPAGAKHAYYVEHGWLAKDRATVVPTHDTLWTLADGGASRLTPETPVTLVYDNGQGLRFERTISVDANYLFSVQQKVVNTGTAAVSLFPYMLASQHGLPQDYAPAGVVHEGPIAYVAGQLYDDMSYNDFDEGKETVVRDNNGWAGITNKYWMVGLIPPQDVVMKTTMRGEKKTEDLSVYQVDMVGDSVSVPAGGESTMLSHVYAGAKEYKLIEGYERTLNLPHFDLMIDFGIWYFLTKPLFFLLTWLTTQFGNVAIAILVLTVIVKGLLFPLTNKSFRSMAGMKKIQPEMAEIQKKHKGDRQKMQEAILALYQREGVNPFNGCWPILIQIPIFFALYKVILIDIALRHAPFWGWVDDMSAKDPTNVFTLFGLIPWDAPSMLQVGLWPIIMGITMALQYRMSPHPTDPTQAAIQKLFPVMLVLMMSPFAAGLIIYWSWSNTLGILQQYVINKRMGVDVSFFGGHSTRKEAIAKAKAEKKEKKAVKKETSKKKDA